MNPSILVVEDDFYIRGLLKEVLEMWGHRVQTAANGQEALELLAKIETPRLILLDLMMPIMNGREFRRKQQQDARYSQIPVVIVSAAGPDVVKASDMGVIESIPKPINLDKLFKIANKYCEMSPQI